jgi:hypothetical protein
VTSQNIDWETNLKDFGHDGVDQWLEENKTEFSINPNHPNYKLWQDLSAAITLETGLIKFRKKRFDWDCTPKDACQKIQELFDT